VNKYTITGLVLVAGCIITAQTPAPAPTKIGIVNLQIAMQNTKEGQASVADLQKRFNEPRTKELEVKRDEVKEMNDRLQRGGNTMSQTAKEELQRQIDARTKSFQRDVEDYNADREEEERKILDDLVVKMRAVIEKYAQENGFRVILDATNPNSGILWWTNEADVTQQIVDAYDKTQPVKSGSTPATKAPATKQPTPPPAPKAPVTPAPGPTK